jgi:hypothetical protein
VSDDDDTGPFHSTSRRLVRGWFWWGLLGLIAFIVASAIAGCRPIPPVQPPTIPDGAPPATCSDACYHLEAELECQAGGACAEVCRKLHGETGQRFKDCILAATSCAQVDVCDQ